MTNITPCYTRYKTKRIKLESIECTSHLPTKLFCATMDLENAAIESCKVLEVPQIKDFQKAALVSALNGNDVFVSYPTGSG